jgi:hypothetical protein
MRIRACSYASHASDHCSCSKAQSHQFRALESATYAATSFPLSMARFHAPTAFPGLVDRGNSDNVSAMLAPYCSIVKEDMASQQVLSL